MEAKSKLNNQHPNILWGFLVGAILTPVLMVVFLIGERFADLPFLPLNFFDWIARSLPGDVITFGIDSMVTLFINLGFGSDLDTVAKTAEQVMGMGLFFGLGTVATGIFFLVLNLIDWDKVSYVPGIVFGLLFGAPLMLLALPISIGSSAPIEMKFLWSTLLFIGFGSAVGWAYMQLAYATTKVSASTGDVENEGIDRREFIVKVGGASATLTVIGAGLGAFLNTQSDGTTVSTGETVVDASADADADEAAEAEDLPNAASDVEPAPGTRPEITPVEDHYRIDILSGLPSIPADYTLPIVGLVANEVDWTLDEIMSMPSQSEFITMSCISNRIAGSLISTTKWTGVSFQDILAEVDPSEDAAALKITGYDNFDEYVDLELIRNDDRIMLAYHFDDAPLPLRNGYPLRIHIPNRYGMKQPKWIRRIEVVDQWEPGYWVRRGWSEQAIVNATSVIDTVATNSVFSDDSGQMFVPIGGMAWAGDRQVVSVEISVDGGEWQPAQLREPLSGRAWTLWRYDWAFEEGEHTFEVRMFEAPPEGQSDPVLQITTERGVRPDGATGIHSETVEILAEQTDA